MDMEEYLLDGKTALMHGKIAESITAFTKAIELDPNNKTALFSRGMAYLKEKDCEAAIKDFLAYIELDSSNEKVYCSMGTAYLGLENTEEALTYFNHSIDINPHYPNAYFGRSETFSRLGETAHAEEDKMTGDRLLKQLSQAYFESQGIMFQDPAG